MPAHSGLEVAMRPVVTSSSRARLLASASLVLLAACGGDGRSDGATAPTAGARGGVAANTGAQSQCTAGVGDRTALTNSVIALFGAGSPNVNSATGKLNAIYGRIDANQLQDAQLGAIDLTEFILRKNRQRELAGGTAMAEQVANAILCFVGLDADVDGDNTQLINPLDPEQIVLGPNGQSGVRFQFDPVTAPTLVTITPIPGPFAPFAGPLGTQLDQYPGFVDITAISIVPNPLKKTATVAICPTVYIDPSVLARARLGHFAEPERFRVEPDGGPGFLTCQTFDPPTASAADVIGRTLSSVFLPRMLGAMMFGGGISGNVNEFSPLGIVDAAMMVGGGISGNVNEFRIEAPRDPAVNLSVASPGARGRGASPSLTLGANAGAPCALLEAPIGTPLDAGCRPVLLATTPSGRVLTGLSVTWAVSGDGANGTIAAAPSPSTCSATVGFTANTTTGPKGGTGVCWTMGPTPGAQALVATIGSGPGLEGGVPSRRVGQLIEPLADRAVSFGATALAPTALVITQQPPTTVVAGAPFGLQVTAVDKNGTTVLGYDGAISLALAPGSFATGSATASATAAQGVATVTGLAINTAGTGYVVTASATAFGATFSAASNAFAVTPDAPFAMAKVNWAENQLVQPGSLLPNPPIVRVTDRFGNVVPNAPVQWLGGLEGGATTTPLTPATVATGTDGRSTIEWRLGNTSADLIAQLALGGDAAPLSETFRAAGISPLRTELSCSLLGGRDPINPSGNQTRFDLSVPGTGQRGISQLQLFLSATGSAGADTRLAERYEVQLDAFQNRRVNGVDVWTPVGTTRQSFALRGNASADEPTTFTFATPIATGNARTYFRMTVVQAPGSSTVLYNVGPCAVGANGSCPPVNATTFPRGCLDVQQNPVGSPATVRRRGVALVVRTR
jgi:hypothetical protein